MRPLIVTPGDPFGVGPEVTAKALASGDGGPVVVIGAQSCADWLERYGVQAPLVVPQGDEPVEVLALREAVSRCLSGSAGAMVTGPIHKGRLAAAGFAHPGHTNFLGELCGVEQPIMAFVGGAVRVALVTVHLPLRDVASHLTRDAIVHTVRTAHHALQTQLRVASPRLLVCGLNPHAGDGGLLGTEERDIVAPAIEQCRSEGFDAIGPVSAEAAFRMALRGDGDMIVATYHDQGLAPLKALDALTGQGAVNWTLGLPIVRTSVDHGTADDIAGKGLADESSMRAALRFARSLVDAAPSDA
jgi:4-hydroxythreonine-4-phosphate dehydrogenase